MTPELNQAVNWLNSYFDIKEKWGQEMGRNRDALALLVSTIEEQSATIKELREAHDKIHKLTQELCYSSGDDRADMQKFICNIGTIGQISRAALAKGKDAK